MCIDRHVNVIVYILKRAVVLRRTRQDSVSDLMSVDS
jgi:hypothetical protein